MNPYEIDFDGLLESKEVKDEKDLLKLKLAVEFLNIISKMTSEEILLKTGLHKSDLSRLRALSLKRFSIDRMISILDSLGFRATFNIKAKKAS